MKSKTSNILRNNFKILFCLLLFFTTVTHLKAQICKKPFHIVILGSSTAYGNGASDLSKAWAYLYRDSLKRIDTNYIVDNLAVPGTTTYAAQPDSYTPPAGRPAPMQGHNITTAVHLNADAIIVNFPSNDAVQNFTLQEQKDNFKRISDVANKHNILIWVTTPQPRDNLTAAQLNSQKNLLAWIKNYFKEKSIDFYSQLASRKDSILYKYNSGDGIHVNNAGHRILYRRVTNENIPDSLCKVKNLSHLATAESSQ